MSAILVAAVARLLFAVFAMQGPAAPAGVITGRILLSDGRPAVGMRVSAMLVPDSARPGAADAGALFSQTQTDENGRYRLGEIPAGRYYIIAGRLDAPTYYPGKEDILTATALSVTSSAPVEGINFTVTESSARIPAARAGVSVTTGPEVEIPVQLRAASGVRIPLMSPQGRTQISARPTVNSMPASGAAMVFRLGNASLVINSGSITAQTVQFSRSTPGVLRTDGSMTVRVSPGEYRFSIDNLPVDYEVTAMSAAPIDLLLNPLQVNGPSVPSIQVTVGLKNPRPKTAAGTTVTGRVLDAATGKEWVAEEISLSGKPGTLFLDGSFEFHGVAPGRYRLEAREGVPGNRTAESNITIGSRNLTANLTYLAPPIVVQVAGRIDVGYGTAPRFRNTRVRLSNTDTPFSVSNDGTFKMALREGTYVLSVTDLPAGFEIKSIASGSVNLLADPLRIEPRNGPVMPDVIVTLSALPRFKVRGRVLADPPTRPVEGAEVLLTNGAEIWKTTARADGTFELSDLLAGPYTLSVRPFGFANVNATIVVADADLNIELKSQPFY